MLREEIEAKVTELGLKLDNKEKEFLEASEDFLGWANELCEYVSMEENAPGIAGRFRTFSQELKDLQGEISLLSNDLIEASERAIGGRDEESD